MFPTYTILNKPNIFFVLIFCDSILAVTYTNIRFIGVGEKPTLVFAKRNRRLQEQRLRIRRQSHKLIFSCSLWFQERFLLLKKITEQRFLRNCKKILRKEKLCPLDPVSEIRKKIHPDPGGKNAPNPGSGSETLNMQVFF
jgi:hypothetical protein